MLYSLRIGAMSLCAALSTNVQAGGSAGLEAAAAPPAAPALPQGSAAATGAGHQFVVPPGWTLTRKPNVSILQSPENRSRVVLVDVEAKTHDSAVAQAWAAYQPQAMRTLLSETPSPDKDGWSDRHVYTYFTTPEERRSVTAGAMRHGEQWLVWISDIDIAEGDRRSADLSLIMERLLPRFYVPESFAGRKANHFDAQRVKALTDFVVAGQRALGVPGVSIGIVQNGRIVFTGGFGLRSLDRPEKVDAETLYLIASTTKPLTTLMLGKLVDQKKLSWDMPVSSVYPGFRLGDEATTRQVQIKHLLCACTGLPRRDLDWLLEFADTTPAQAVSALAAMQPTSRFGETFQYSNRLAAAAGFVGGHVAFPAMEVGEAYDAAMRSLVFEPLGMNATTFDFGQALAANHASAHAFDIDGKPSHALFDINYAIVPFRPAGGAWSNVNDLLKYVSMELAKGKLPDGSRYVSSQVLEDRGRPNVLIGDRYYYGMGLMISDKYDVRVVSHAGSMFGYRSTMFWLPEHDVGAVMLTNADQGDTFWTAFPRKFLEILFDGKPEADTEVRVAAKATQERIAAARKLIQLPPDRDVAGSLAARYVNPDLGTIEVRNAGDQLMFDFGEWQSPVGSRRHPDGSKSLVTTAPSFAGKEFVLGKRGDKRLLMLRDPQSDYAFVEE